MKRTPLYPLLRFLCALFFFALILAGVHPCCCDGDHAPDAGDVPAGNASACVCLTHSVTMIAEHSPQCSSGPVFASMGHSADEAAFPSGFVLDIDHPPQN